MGRRPLVRRLRRRWHRRSPFPVRQGMPPPAPRPPRSPLAPRHYRNSRHAEASAAPPLRRPATCRRVVTGGGARLRSRARRTPRRRGCPPRCPRRRRSPGSRSVSRRVSGSGAQAGAEPMLDSPPPRAVSAGRAGKLLPRARPPRQPEQHAVRRAPIRLPTPTVAGAPVRHETRQVSYRPPPAAAPPGPTNGPNSAQASHGHAPAIRYLASRLSPPA